jgi:hypothetical protein
MSVLPMLLLIVVRKAKATALVERTLGKYDCRPTKKQPWIYGGDNPSIPQHSSVGHVCALALSVKGEAFSYEDLL